MGEKKGTPAALGRQELQDQLRRREEELLDLEEERRFTLGQTGVHLGAGKVASLRSAWERDEVRLREEVTALKASLAELEGVAGD